MRSERSFVRQAGVERRHARQHDRRGGAGGAEAAQ